MSLNAMQLLGPNEVSKRIALWVRDYSAKELANMFTVSERTARGWREGNMPQNVHLIAMVERWGTNFLEDVFAPVLNIEVDTERRLERIQHEINSIKLNKKVIFSLVLVVLSSFQATIDDNPMVRAPRPTAARSRRET